MTPRRKMTEEKRREKLVRELLTVFQVKNGEDLNNLVKDIIAQMVGGVLQGEMDDHLGYDKYDTKNKDTTNSRNGYGKKHFIPHMMMPLSKYQETGMESTTLLSLRSIKKP